MSLVAAGEEGFKYAPLSKIIVLTTCGATLGDWIAQARAISTVSPVVKALAFDTFLQLACFLLMMYNCRAFERRVGSRKFGSFITGGVVAGLGMALGWEQLSTVQHGIHGLPYLPFLTLPPTLCNVSHYVDSGQEQQPGLQPVNGNLVLLCVGVTFIALCGHHNLLPCVACLLLGFMYQANSFSLQRLLIPDALCEALLLGPGKWLGFSPRATVRVAPAQRAQAPRPPSAQLPPGAQADESAVARIMAMGFQRGEAVQALLAAGNDLDAAVSRLL